jgi:hypothetical protein
MKTRLACGFNEMRYEVAVARRTRLGGAEIRNRKFSLRAIEERADAQRN